MTLDREDLARMASEWWLARADDGFYNSPGTATDDESDRISDLEREIGAAGSDPLLLGSLLEELVAAAPPGELRFIGTWHLENAYPQLGDRVLEILDVTNLDDNVKAQIREGFVW